MTPPGLFAKRTICQTALVCWFLLASAAPGISQESAGLPPADNRPVDGEATDQPPRLPSPEGAKPLFKGGDFAAWVDPRRGVVLIDGQVTLRAGPLEMFACIQKTKEHESVVAVNTQAFPIHAALLALGAEPGHPVQFQPKFAPPAGTEIDIEVRWRDTEGQWQSARAQEWVRDVNTGGGTKEFLGLRWQHVLDRSKHGPSVLSGRRWRFHLRLQLCDGHARFANRKYPDQSGIIFRSLYRTDSPPGNARSPGAQAAAA